MPFTNLEQIKASSLPVVIFGAGSSGEALYYAALANGITLSAFAELYTPNINRVSASLHGLPIVYMGELTQKFDDAVFLISSNYIGDFVRDLGRLGFDKWFPGGLLLKDFDLTSHFFVRGLPHARHSVEATIYSHEAYLDPKLVYMRSVDVQVTERCSMKCNNCSNLMHLYEHPENFSAEDIMRWVDSFCNNVDKVGEARIIGGEPFMHKDSAKIVRHCAEKEQFSRVTIFTNGTIPLTEEQLELTCHPKVVYLITSYEGFRKKHESITAALTKHGIRWVLQEASGWTDCGHILEKQNRPPEVQRQFFESCCANKLFTISHGHLYRCPWNANAVGLKAFPDYKADYVDLTGTGVLKDKIRWFINNLPFLQACDFCPGRKLDDPEITPGVQVKTPQPYPKLVQIG